MFERISSDTKQAIVAAHQEAAAAGADRIDTAHLLVGIATDPASPGAAVLADLGARAPDLRAQLLAPPASETDFDDDDRDALAAIGIDLTEVQRRLEEQLGDLPSSSVAPTGGDQGPARKHPRMSQDAKDAIAGAIRHALAERTRKIRPDHLLLAIADNAGTAGAQLLAHRGLRAADVHAAAQHRRGAA